MISSNGGRSSATPENNLPDRRKPAHFSTVESRNRSIIIFLTVCIKGRRPLLANKEATQLLTRAWSAANHWLVGRYVILPDHLHLFCAPNTFPPNSLKNWITFWKNYVTRAWPNRGEIPLWQTEYWDTQLRRGESYSEKWDYVENNPVRHGLVTKTEDWPYRGELNLLDWHD